MAPCRIGDKAVFVGIPITHPMHHVDGSGAGGDLGQHAKRTPGQPGPLGIGVVAARGGGDHFAIRHPGRSPGRHVDGNTLRPGQIERLEQFAGTLTARVENDVDKYRLGTPLKNPAKETSVKAVRWRIDLLGGGKAQIVDSDDHEVLAGVTWIEGRIQ